MSTIPKFLVTGATGYTASYTIPTLLEKGVQVRALVHRLDVHSEKLAVNLTGRQPLGIREFIRQHRTYFE
jgi:uncharacterized protein YbjT (DUF2867 family)